MTKSTSESVDPSECSSQLLCQLKGIK